MPNSVVGDRVARLNAWEPGLEDRGRVVDAVLQRERAAVEQHHHERLSGRLDRADQLLLPPRQVECAARCGLAAHLACLAHGEDDLVGRLRGGDRLGEAGVGAATSGSVCGGSVLDSLQPSAYVAPGLCALMPSKTVTASWSRPALHHGRHVVLVAGQRPDHGRLLGRIDGQDRAPGS